MQDATRPTRATRPTSATTAVESLSVEPVGALEGFENAQAPTPAATRSSRGPREGWAVRARPTASEQGGAEGGFRHGSSKQADEKASVHDNGGYSPYKEYRPRSFALKKYDAYEYNFQACQNVHKDLHDRNGQLYQTVSKQWHRIDFVDDTARSAQKAEFLRLVWGSNVLMLEGCMHDCITEVWEKAMDNLLSDGRPCDLRTAAAKWRGLSKFLAELRGGRRAGAAKAGNSAVPVPSAPAVDVQALLVRSAHGCAPRAAPSAADKARLDNVRKNAKKVHDAAAGRLCKAAKALENKGCLAQQQADVDATVDNMKAACKLLEDAYIAATETVDEQARLAAAIAAVDDLSWSKEKHGCIEPEDDEPLGELWRVWAQDVYTKAKAAFTKPLVPDFGKAIDDVLGLVASSDRDSAGKKGKKGKKGKESQKVAEGGATEGEEPGLPGLVPDTFAAILDNLVRHIGKASPAEGTANHRLMLHIPDSITKYGTPGKRAKNVKVAPQCLGVLARMVKLFYGARCLFFHGSPDMTISNTLGYLKFSWADFLPPMPSQELFEYVKQGEEFISGVAAAAAGSVPSNPPPCPTLPPRMSKGRATAVSAGTTERQAAEWAAAYLNQLVKRLVTYKRDFTPGILDMHNCYTFIQWYIRLIDATVADCEAVAFGRAGKATAFAHKQQDLAITGGQGAGAGAGAGAGIVSSGQSGHSATDSGQSGGATGAAATGHGGQSTPEWRKGNNGRL